MSLSVDRNAWRHSYRGEMRGVLVEGNAWHHSRRGKCMASSLLLMFFMFKIKYISHIHVYKGIIENVSLI